MTTNKTEVKVLASWSGRGDYDLPRQSRVVQRGGKTYLVHDWYGGEQGLRGGAFRAHVYEVPAGLTSKVVELVANGDDGDYDEDSNGHASKIRTLEYDVIGEGLLKDLGEQGRLKWTAEL